MAKPSKKSETKVTRIKATDSSPEKTETKTTKTKPTVIKKEAAKTTVKTKAQKLDNDGNPIESRNIFARMGRYFKGSWAELRQVRWPDRKATWSMTGALVVFTLFFVLVILLLDYGFSQLFKLIIGN